jgi:CheY-like chemotaxis protein
MAPTTTQGHGEHPLATHQYYMDIINCMPNIVYWIDVNCTLLGCNINFVNLLNLKTLKEFTGTPYEQMKKHLPWSMDSIKTLQLNDMSAIFSGTAQYNHEEGSFNKPNNKEVVYYKATRVPLFDHQKHVIGLVVILIETPVENTIKQPPTPVPIESPLDTNTQSSQPSIRVMIVEDNIVAQTVEQELLCKLQCIVDLADSGEAAMQLFKPGKYDLIFMDISLLDTSGYIVSKMIRKLENNTPHHVPIIAVTTHQADIVKKDCQDYFMEDVITKPLTSEQAMAIIKQYVYQGRCAKDSV